MTMRHLAACAVLAAATWSCGRTTVDGIVRDAEGADAADCHVTSVLVWDASGRVADPPAPVVTRTGRDGRFTLPRLVSGTHLLVAARALEGTLDEAGAARVARQVAAGTRPEGHVVGMTPLHVDGSGIVNFASGSTVTLGAPPGQGLRVAGRLQGHVRPEEFLYDICFNGWCEIDGERETWQLHGVPDADGRFDLGWVKETSPSWLSVRVGPRHWRELHSDVVDEVVGDSDARLVELPFHARVGIRVEGATSYAFGRTPQLEFTQGPRFAGMCQVPDERGVAWIVREGSIDVRATAEGMASATRTISLAPDRVPEEVVLTLVPEGPDRGADDADAR